MGKNQSASGLTNVIQYSNGNITFVSGSTTLMSISSSGAITTTGVISGSNVLTASYANNAELLDGLDSTAFATTGAYSATSGSLYTVSSSAYATSGSLSATSGSLSAASGSFNTRVSALEVTGSALSSSILSVSSSAYATSGSLSTDSGSFNSRVASLETYSTNLTAKTASFATTGSNTFIGSQVVSGSLTASGSITATGTITAQTLVVQTITSSVVYSSGSNVFGNDIGNSQRFTGSVLITGSLTIAGASSATSYSGATIFGSTIACSPIGCFATSCATSFIGGTMSGTTIYGSTAVCSPVGKFTSCIDAGSGNFSGKIFALRNNIGTGTTDDADISLNVSAPSGSGKFIMFGRDGANTAVFSIASSGHLGGPTATFSSTVCALRFIWSSGSTESFLTTGGGNTAIGNGGTAGLALYSSNTLRLTISATGESTFTCRVCVSGLSTNASLTMDSSSPLSFSGTGGYIYMYSRRAGGSCGGILINNGTGNNLWFGEVGSHVYGFSTGGVGTDYTGTPLLNLDVNTQRIGIGCTTPDYKLDISGSLRTTAGTYLGTSSSNVIIGGTTSDLIANFKFMTIGNTAFQYGASTGTYLRIEPGAADTEVALKADARSGGYPPMTFYTTATERMRITSTGIACFACQVCAPQICSTYIGASCFLEGPLKVGLRGCYITAPAAIPYIYYSERFPDNASGAFPFNQYGELIFQASNRAGYNSGFSFVTGTAEIGCTATVSVKARISDNSIVGYSQFYSTYTKATCTPDGGSQTVRYIEDSLGQWIQVGRFCAPGYTTIAETWSSVRGLSTSLAQDATTEFSADWGGSKPTEIRIMGATDFCKWRETRTIDFIYRNIPGRPWCVFFNGGSTNGNVLVCGVPRYGFNTCGNYDGFGRWNSHDTCMIGMSDGEYCNPSSAYTSPTGSAFNWYTTGDAKLSAGHVPGYAGQDASWTTSFGYDDTVAHFNDVFPSQTSQGGAGVTMTSAVWILLKFN